MVIAQAPLRVKTTAPAPNKSDVNAAIDGELWEEFYKIWAAEKPDPVSAREMGKEVGPRVRAHGFPKVTNKRVEELAMGGQYDVLRRHKTKKSKTTETEITAARNRLIELKAARTAASS